MNFILWITKFIFGFKKRNKIKKLRKQHDYQHHLPKGSSYFNAFKNSPKLKL